MHVLNIMYGRIDSEFKIFLLTQRKPLEESYAIHLYNKTTLGYALHNCGLRASNFPEDRRTYYI